MPGHTRQVIAVIDDDPEVLATVADSLRRQGYAVVLAPDDWSAETIARMPFDALVTDLMMPRVNGLEVIKAVRERRPEAAIVALSGYLHLPEFAASELTGADRVLAKPFRPDALRRAIVETIEKKRGEHAAGR